MASFSRLQLAAALIEYDNDDADQSKPRRNAQESAIFAHLRRSKDVQGMSAARRSTDYLGISLPSETDSIAGRESIADGRHSRSSIDALRNPFGRDSTHEGVLDDDEEQSLEVDLTSWGLEAFMPKDRESKSARKKAAHELPNPHPQSPSEGGAVPRPIAGRHSASASRSMSMSGFDSFGEGGAFLDAKSTVDSLGGRRHSIGSPLDIPAKLPTQQYPQHGRAASVHALIENLPATPPLHTVPFPSSSSRPVSPFFDEPPPTARPMSQGPLSDTKSHARTISVGSRMLVNEDAANPFAVRPPSPDRASRFDPKTARMRSASNASMGTIMASGLMQEEPNLFAVRPPSPSRSSRFDPKVRVRTMSQASMGTQMMLDNDGISDAGRPRRDRPYSRLELMRPKVLIMPSPLQHSAGPSAPSPSVVHREGFELTTDGRPLPPGARTSRRASSTLSMLDPSGSTPPIASNSFTPNPRASLTLSQLTFRNNLAVDGQRDVAYADLEKRLRRATEDGEQVDLEALVEEAPAPPVVIQTPDLGVDDTDRSRRPAGKLYGKSLIDDLEARKAEMRGKVRVFTGDQRPSMMARTPMQRSSTLIDPESLKQRPVSQLMDTSRSQSDLIRRNSANIKPLLNFDDVIPGAPRTHLDAMPTGTTKSVFGVDTLWERELAKLRVMEEGDRLEAEERRKNGVSDETGRGKKRKGRGKKNKREDKGDEFDPEPEGGDADENTSSMQMPREPRPPSPLHMLPAIQKVAARRAPPPPVDGDETEEGSDSDDARPGQPGDPRRSQVESWFAGASDDEDAGRGRIKAAGPPAGHPSQSLRLPQVIRTQDDSSEEDLPLVATLGRAAQRVSRLQIGPDDSDEDEPLTAVLDKRKTMMGGTLSPGASRKADDDEDDDDNQPLGLRVSRAFPASPISVTGSVPPQPAGEEDDMPLAFHPEQMRRTQYMMAQQQQQQQMMMQAQAAQLHQSMIFGTPSMMASGFFGPPIPPHMMAPAPIQPSPPPMHDAGKFGRVDKWRHDVAVEGET
ncbi:hypothetical protein CERSUDRAFT_111413 [Gelatoporia subvermispora B]|uniref:Uncharacterized protein n=1 Tax=Ceriporiopsis subvermispora (strain B) TaxID=914234 RepID=M2RQU4_CERS8|nr:hypothetical protein CERSUDRAFT_111413 [Gelatoporia subvermispora B]